MITKSFVIKNKLGLHARTASLLAQTASKFQSEIRIEKDGMEVDGRSIVEIMTLGALKGSRIKIKAQGSDALEAISEIGKLIRNRFGEG